MKIIIDDFIGGEVFVFLEEYLFDMYVILLFESVYVLDVEVLKVLNIIFFSGWKQ